MPFIIVFFLILMAVVLITDFGGVWTTYLYPIVEWAHANIWLIVGIFAAYVFIGCIYSIVKWNLYLSNPDVQAKIKKQFVSFKQESLRRYKESIRNKYDGSDYRHLGHLEIDELIKADIAKWTGVNLDDFKKSDANFLKASQYKFTIISWMLWWPFSLVWLLTHDLFEHAYHKLVGMFSNMAFRKIDKVLKDESTTNVS